MKILYTTDLHGNIDKYNQVLSRARKFGVQAVINGGDMFPKHGDLFKNQKEFISNFLTGHFKKYEQEGICYLCMPGNDDLAIFDYQLETLIQSTTHIYNIAQRLVPLWGYEFIGINYVVDYPFRLKDRCRMDNKDFQFPDQLGTGLLSVHDGRYYEIPDWKGHAQKLETLEGVLRNMPPPLVASKAIYVIHMPPANLSLDVCASKDKNGAHIKVGSRSVYDFLLSKQPLLSLHGHIHESPWKSGCWKNTIGKTVCIQPGQLNQLSYVLIDLDQDPIEITRH